MKKRYIFSLILIILISGCAVDYEEEGLLEEPVEEQVTGFTVNSIIYHR